MTRSLAAICESSHGLQTVALRFPAGTLGSKASKASLCSLQNWLYSIAFDVSRTTAVAQSLKSCSFITEISWSPFLQCSGLENICGSLERGVRSERIQLPPNIYAVKRKMSALEHESGKKGPFGVLSLHRNLLTLPTQGASLAAQKKVPNAIPPRWPAWPTLGK